MYLYIIHVKKPSRDCFYTGITNDITRRYSQHLMGVGSRWAKRYFRGAHKKLVYVEKMPQGMLWRKREKEVKALSPLNKKKLINSESNIIERVNVATGLYGVRVDIKLKEQIAT